MKLGDAEFRKFAMPVKRTEIPCHIIRLMKMILPLFLMRLKVQDEEEIKAEMKMLKEAEKQVKLAKK